MTTTISQLVDSAIVRSNIAVEEALDQEVDQLKINGLLEAIGALQGELLFVNYLNKKENQNRKLFGFVTSRDK